MESVVMPERIAERERFGHWRELVREGFAPMDIAAERHERFQVEQRVLSLGTSQVWEAACSSSEAVRTGTHIRQSDPETLCVLVPLNGTLLAESAGHSVACGVGDLFVHDTSHPMRSVFREPPDGRPFRGVAVMVPRTALPLSNGRIDRVVGLRVPQGEGVGALLSTFLTQLMARSGDLRAQDGPGLGAVARELTGTLVARIADAEVPAARPGREVLALRAKEFIARNLGDEDLTPAAVAAAQHISVSYLHDVFRCQGTSVARWIRHQRLENARRDLADPARASLSIQEISVRWGFRHPADFSRAFRSAYGLTPREHRRGGPAS